MSQAENENQAQPQATFQDEQLVMIRQSLLNHVFEKYHHLIAALKKLPIAQQIPGAHHAYLQIDGAMLWFKEIINTAPLMLAPAPEKKEESAPSEEQAVVENEKPLESSNPKSEPKTK